MKAHLTDITVKTLKPSERQVDYFCVQTRNFGVRVSPGGTKTFFVLTGPATARKRVTLGTYPDTTLKAARRAAHLTTPSPSIAGIPTVAEATKAYLENVRANYRSRSAYLTERLLTLHFSDLARRPLPEITPQVVYDAVKPLRPSEANHAFAAFKTFLAWSSARYTMTNPLQNSPKPNKEESRDRTLSDQELFAIWHACSDSQHNRIVKALILSGQRRGEMAALQSGWMTEDTITFPKEITKNKREHTIPLTPRLTAVLRPDVYYNGWGKHKSALDEASGVSNWTLHDLRRTFSTNMARIGIPINITERILNHRTGSETPISRIYNRYTYIHEMREALERYEHFLFTTVLREQNR